MSAGITRFAAATSHTKAGEMDEVMFTRQQGDFLSFNGFENYLRKKKSLFRDDLSQH